MESRIWGYWTALAPRLALFHQSSTRRLCIVALPLQCKCHFPATVGEQVRKPPYYVSKCPLDGISAHIPSDSLAGGILICGIGYLALRQIRAQLGNKERAQTVSTVFYAQCLLVVITMLITASSVLNLQAKRGLPLVNQAMGWIVFGMIPRSFQESVIYVLGRRGIYLPLHKVWIGPTSQGKIDPIFHGLWLCLRHSIHQRGGSLLLRVLGMPRWMARGRKADPEGQRGSTP